MTKPQLPSRPTLADVAAEAGVSAVTVSRMLNGTHNVSDATRDKVTQAMVRLGYYGNAAATQLVSGKTHVIGVLTSNISEYGYARVIEGIELRARERGYSVLISVMDVGSTRAPRESVAPIASQALAGVIVLDFDADAVPTVQALPAYLPVITTSGPVRAAASKLPTVFFDDAQGGRQAAELLIELGHRSVFVMGPPHDDPDETRTRGVVDAIQDARLPMFPIYSCENWTPESGYHTMREILENYGSMVTAVVCANDQLALGAIHAIYDAGLSVPGDISVVGFDDNPIAEHTLPPLTTVRQDFHVLGIEAFDLLEKVIDGESVPSQSGRNPELIVRGSTAAPSATRGLSLPQ